MGFWRTARGIGGDSWADEFDAMMKRLVREATNPDDGPCVATMQELADLVEFCTCGHLIVEVRHPEDAGRPLSELHSNGVETYPNRGQIHCPEEGIVLGYVQHQGEHIVREAQEAYEYGNPPSRS